MIPFLCGVFVGVLLGFAAHVYWVIRYITTDTASLEGIEP